MNAVRTAVQAGIGLISGCAPAHPAANVRFIILSSALAALVVLEPLHAATPVRRLLVLTADTHGSRALSDLEDAIRRAVSGSQQANIEVDLEHLDFVFFPTRQGKDAALVNLLQAKYGERQPDIVLPIGKDSLDFVLAHREVFPNAQILFAHVLKEDIAGLQPAPNVGGVVSDWGTAKTAETILDLLPATHRIIVILGSGPVERTYEPVFRKGLEPIARRVHLEWWIGIPPRDLEQRVAQLPPYTAVLYLGVYGDKEGGSYAPPLVVERLSRVSSAPVFGTQAHWVGRGTIGDGRFSYAMVGTQLGELAVRVLDGETAGRIGAVPATLPPQTFDARLLDRFAIPRSRLPEASNVLNETPSLWEADRGSVITVLAVMIAQALLLSAIIWQKLARMRAEHAESESRNLYTSVADSLDERVAIVDSGGTIVWTNRAWREFAAYHDHKDLGPGDNYVRSIENAIQAGRSDAVRTLDSLTAVLSGREPTRRLEYFAPAREPWRYEMRIVALKRDDGGVLITVQDVTDRWQAEERVRLALESLPFATFLLDVSGTIELVNGEAERLFGHPRAELLGSPLTFLIPEYLIDPDSANGDGSEPILAGIRADGSEVPVQIRTRALSMTTRHMILVSMQDLSERRRLAAEVHRLREETAHFNRVAAVGEMSAAIAHELNQPLAGIMMNCQAAQRLLAKQSFTIPDVIETFGDIVADARRAGEVIQRLRLMLRKSPPDVRPIDVNETVKQVHHLVAHDLALKRASLELELAEDLPPVHADRVHLQQVMLNLALNAADAMAATPLDARRMVLRTRPGINHTVELEVRDSGPGIPSDIMNRVFEPFFTTKKNGMGMGLSIVRSIVESHGGNIKCENAASGGAVFTVTLPAGGHA